MASKLEQLNQEANKPKDEPIPKTFSDLTIKDILSNTANVIILVSQELFTKPQTTPWTEYLIETCTKEDRYLYLGTLLIITSLYFMMVSNM
jgi:hypothetical protein